MARANIPQVTSCRQALPFGAARLFPSRSGGRSKARQSVLIAVRSHSAGQRSSGFHSHMAILSGRQSIPALTSAKPGVSVSSGAVRRWAKSRSTSSRPLAALATLAALGCASGQGFYFAKPLEASAPHWNISRGGERFSFNRPARRRRCQRSALRCPYLTKIMSPVAASR